LRIDLERGALFETSALDYEQYRPSYPSPIIREVVALSNLKSSSRILEIGCGTGKATVHFASRGYTIDCIDPGERLLAFAKRNCQAWQNVTFKTGKFEHVRLEAGSYDLIFSAHALHWVEPKVRLSKAANLIADDGSIALIYNYPGEIKDPMIQSLMYAIKEESGGKLTGWDYLAEVVNWKNEIANSGLFRNIQLVRHRWMNRYSAESYVGLLRTYSDFLTLPKVLQRRVVDRIREIIIENGGCVCRSYDCVLIHANKI
jgi:SAM-dependent methyltransferase